MRRSSRVTADRIIPHFGLYGESFVSKDPGFVHIEEIAARSRENDWLIRPHRHDNMFQVLCMFDGEVKLNLDEQAHSLAGGWVVTIPPGVVHGFHFQPDTDGAVLTLAEPLLTAERYQRSRRHFGELIGLPHTIEFQAQSTAFRQLRQYLKLITREFRETQPGYELMLEWLVGMVLMVLQRQLDRHRLEVSGGTPGNRLLHEFRVLLEQNYRRQWKVQQYAAALNVSVSSLNRICKDSIGITAKSVVQNRVLIEVKRQLIYTRTPLDQIAESLGFNDPAYFSRFFKKQEGMPPSRYREFHTSTSGDPDPNSH